MCRKGKCALIRTLSLLINCTHHSDVRVVTQTCLTEDGEVLQSIYIRGRTRGRETRGERGNGGAMTRRGNSTYRLLPILTVVRVS